jgi:hypothetical protein
MKTKTKLPEKNIQINYLCLAFGCFVIGMGFVGLLEYVVKPMGIIIGTIYSLVGLWFLIYGPNFFKNMRREIWQKEKQSNEKELQRKTKRLQKRFII